MLFIAIPIIEMVILIEVGGLIGALPTVGLVLLTATIGLWLLRREGLATLESVRQKIDQGVLPETELLEGVMLLVGGALLLTPGFVTDTIGFICLLPGLRHPIARAIMGRAETIIVGKTRDGGTIIDGEFTREDNRPNHDEDNRLQ